MTLAQALWARRKETHGAEDDLVFTADRGGRIIQTNLTRRVLKPAVQKAGVGAWVSFHTFRHTCATILFRRGWNAVQVQKFLGHADTTTTMRVYIHLLDEDLPEPDFGELCDASDSPGRKRGEHVGGNVPSDADHAIAEPLPLRSLLG